MERVESDIAELMRVAAGLPDGNSTKIQSLLQAIQLADAHQLLDLQYRTRLDLLGTATFSGYSEQAFAAFTWCLGQTDRDPDRYPIQSLLWKFKYVLDSAAQFPGLTRAQIEAMFDNMRIRYAAAGYSQRPVHMVSARAAMYMGDIELANQRLNEYEKHKRDRYADCSACELDTRVQGLLLARQYDAALTAVDPIVRGQKSCAEIPHLTLANLVLPLLARQRAEEAQMCHEKGYPLIAKNRSYLTQVALHMSYLMHAGRLRQTLDLFERHLPWALDTAEWLKRLNFYGAAWAVMECGARENPATRVQVPRAMPLCGADGKAGAAELALWFEREATDLARRFDNRNGNAYYQTKLAARHEPRLF